MEEKPISVHQHEQKHDCTQPLLEILQRKLMEDLDLHVLFIRAFRKSQ